MQTFTAVIHREEDMFVAECLEVGTTSQGATVEEAATEPQRGYTALPWKSSLCFTETLEKLRLLQRVYDMPEISSLAISKDISCSFRPGKRSRAASP